MVKGIRLKLLLMVFVLGFDFEIMVEGGSFWVCRIGMLIVIFIICGKIIRFR